MEEIVSMAVLEDQNRTICQATGLKIRKLVEAFCGDQWGQIVREYPMLRSNKEFRDLLDCWIGISERFTVEKYPYDKVTLYRLTSKSGF